MIRLRSDCQVFKLGEAPGEGGNEQELSLEVTCQAGESIDEGLIRNAAEAVLHYFKEELGWSSVSLNEFCQALERVLGRLGVKVTSASASHKCLRVAEADLRQLACESGKGFELVFFARLRKEVRRRLGEFPQVLRFCGLRGCVKQLSGAQRWSPRCQTLNDQIVEYLRTCLSADGRGARCALVVV